MISRRHFIQAAAACAALPPARAANAKALLLAHRGASALRPEHTLAAYARAIADGADYVEPDLVMTKDGVLVARHEVAITGTTNVASRSEFASRKTRKVIDGEAHEGWFVNDFTFAELKTLRAVERLPQVRPGSASYDGQFQVVSFEEIIDFVAAESAARGRMIGLIPELKHSTWHAQAGLPLEERFLATLDAHAYTRAAPVEIQSAEVGNQKAIRAKIGRPANVKLMQLAGPGPMLTPSGLRDIATYADVVGPPTRAVIPLGADDRLLAPTSLVADAHRAGLLVHVWTFRPENQFLAADFRNAAGPNTRNEAGSIAEMRRYLETGIDGLFSDDSALGRIAIDGR